MICERKVDVVCLTMPIVISRYVLAHILQPVTELSIGCDAQGWCVHVW